MRHKQRNPIKLSTTLGAMLLSSVLLASCNGGGSAAVAIINAGIGGTGIVFGTITGFGSVWVNGRRFEIDDAEIIVDGEVINIDPKLALAVGMVVRLDVDPENVMFGGVANKVEFDDEIEGPVDGLPIEVGSGVKRINILGQKIMVDATRTLFVGTSYTTVGANDILEVSGFRVDGDPALADDDRIVATYVEKVGTYNPLTDTPEVELRGKVSDLVEGVSFKIYDVQINYVGVNVDVDGGQLVEGMFVEVEGIFVSPEVNAVEIVQEDENFGTDVDDISLHGVVSRYVPIADGGDGLARFFVNGQRVNASAAKLEPADLESLMQNGLEVEVEGEIVDGVLIAEELELRADTELRTTVLDVDYAAGTFVVDYPFVLGKNTVTVNTSVQTLFEDDTGVVSDFSLDDLKKGDFVEVEGVEINDAVSAHTVERRKANDVKLQGAVDAFVPEVSITILGITYPVDALTMYSGMTATDFYATLRKNDIVELEDYEPDGIADAAEIDD